MNLLYFGVCNMMVIGYGGENLNWRSLELFGAQVEVLLKTDSFMKKILSHRIVLAIIVLRVWRKYNHLTKTFDL